MQSFYITQLLVVSAGGALGAVGRFLLSNQMYVWMGKSFAWGTLAVNVLGSFLLGVFVVVLLEKFGDHSHLKSFIIVGFLGSFTTFSTFSYETFLFLQSGEFSKAFLNIFVSVIVGLIAVLIGIWAAKQLL